MYLSVDRYLGDDAADRREILRELRYRAVSDVFSPLLVAISLGVFKMRGQKRASCGPFLAHRTPIFAI